MGEGRVLRCTKVPYATVHRARCPRVPGPDVFLPFEGDTVLSTILSKALLLVDDTGIKDLTIIRQIRGPRPPGRS